MGSDIRDDSADRCIDVRPDARLFDRLAVGAFFSYLALSVLIFGREVLVHPATVYLGQGPDPQTPIWGLVWWVYAISHHLNPLLTTEVWAPAGASLAWAASVLLLPSYLLYPITWMWGPIVSNNVLLLVAPALAGWSAFVLCRYVVHHFWPAWLGGCLFAFSPFILASMAEGALYILVFPVPLAVWATLRRLANELAAHSFLAILVVLLVLQFMLAIEIFATATFFGAICLCLAATSSSTDKHKRLRSATLLIASAYAISALILAPYLYYMFAFEKPRSGYIFLPWHTSIDLANFLVPTNVNELGKLLVCRTITSSFFAHLYDSTGYVGLPLMAITALFTWKHWRDRTRRFVVLLFGSACVLAMGPFLEIAGRMIMPFPGAALLALPLIDKAQPGRFMLYADLSLSLVVAVWITEKKERRGLHWALGVALILFMLPNLSASFWTTPAELPAFFRTRMYQQYLTRGQTVLVLPFGLYGEGMLWQASTGMYFRMVGGYVGWAPPIPEEHSRWPIMSGFYRIAGVPEASDQLKAYMANHNVNAIILGRHSHYVSQNVDSRRPWLLSPTTDRERMATQALLGSLGTRPLEIGGVILYRLAPQTLAPYRQLTALDMQRRAARARFEALLRGAERYLAEGGDPRSLSPERVQQLGLLPLDWFGGAVFSAFSPVFNCRVVLRPAKPTGISVGVEGSYDALQPIVESYGAEAGQTFFPYPVPISSSAPPHGTAMMVMTFDSTGLERAAAAASAALARPPVPLTAHEIP